MSVLDIITRVDAICKRYDKYDIDKQRNSSTVAGDDAFARLYSMVESELNAALEKAEAASSEKNRAAAVAMNAEVRRTKARLLEHVPKLQRLALKKIRGLSKEEHDARSDLVAALKERVLSVPDGAGGPGQQTGGWASSTSWKGVKIETSSEERYGSGYHEESEESSKFREEYEMRKIKQDQGLDVISEGLDTLKGLAHDINEEFDRQLPLMDEIDEKADRAAADLKSTNVRLKDTVTKLRSSRNFCIDIVLLCIILGIALYLYNVLK